MQHLLSFEQPMSEPWTVGKYQIMHLESVGRVQLWVRYATDTEWEIGHSKDIPCDWSAMDVAQTMRQFILGEIDHAEYNRLLP